jgi:DNA-binding CsgD family transcriptional regulator/tetratricopeptide (TPR) repeat protein
VPLDTAASPLIGRTEDLGRLLAVSGLDDDAGGLVLVSGDAGIGKSRLITEAADAAAQHGRLVLVGHCVGEAGASLPYLPFAEVLGRLATVQPETFDALLAAHPTIARLVAGRSAPAEPETGMLDRAAVFEAVHAGVEDLAARQPVLLVVEDLHWADQSSRDLLTLLFTRGFTAPVSLVASYRSDDLHRKHPLRATLAIWSRIPGLRRVDLGPLRDEDIRAIVTGASGVDLSETVVDSVVDRADGNAFFAEELSVAAALGRAGAGDDLSRLLMVRFEQLSDQAQDVVRLASSAGRRISYPLLAGVAAAGPGLGEPELDRALREAVEKHVLVPADGQGYTFRHALLAETVYEDLLPSERSRSHGVFARVLRDDPSLGTAADLARHAGAAGDVATALAASIEAGDAAMTVGGPAEALSHYDRAIGLAPGDDNLRDELVVKAAQAAIGTGRLERAMSLLKQRLRERPSDADPEGRALLLAHLATTARLTESPIDRLDLIKEALSIVPWGVETPLHARLLAAHAEALADRERDEEAARVAQEAAEIAGRLQMRALGGEIESLRARLVERQGQPEQSRQRLERLISEWDDKTDLPLLRALHHLASLHHRQGRLPEALAAFQEAARRAREVGLQWAPFAHDARMVAVLVAHQMGEWDVGERLADFSGEHPPEEAAAGLLAAGLNIAAGRGRAEAVSALARVRRQWPSDGFIVIAATGAAIDLYGDAGLVDEAWQAHAEGVAFLRELWKVPVAQAEVRLDALLVGQLATAAPELATARRREYIDHAEQLVRSAAQVWPEVSGPGGPGPEGRAWIARLRAELLRLRWASGMDAPELSELVDAWHAAVDAMHAYGHAFEEARSQARLAAVLAAAGDGRAAELVATASATAARLRAEPLTRELRSLQSVVGGSKRRRQPVPGTDGSGPAATARGGSRVDPAVPPAPALTPREHEILEHLAQGQTNGQIGRQLFISTKTASVHVSNILAKLGVSTRGEAVAEARRRGLLGA